MPDRKPLVVVVGLAGLKGGEVVVHDNRLRRPAFRTGNQQLACDGGYPPILLASDCDGYPPIAQIMHLFPRGRRSQEMVLVIRIDNVRAYLPLSADGDLHGIGTRVGLEHRTTVAPDGAHK